MEQKSITRRLDRLSALEPARRRADAGFPEVAKIELTARCDLQCYFCAVSIRKRRQGDMSPELLYRILGELKELGVRELGLFHLGESFLLPALPEYVRHAKHALGFDYVFLSTNGRAATPERLKPVLDAGLDSLKFSINAGTRESYKRVTGVDAFERVLENVRFARRYRGERAKPGLYASSIRTRENGPELDALKELLRPHVDEHYELPLYSQAGHVHGVPGGTLGGNRGRLGSLREALPCWSLLSQAHITYDGKLSACCFDHDGRFAMADLSRQSLLESWNQPKFIELRRRHLLADVAGTPCESCAAPS